MRSKRTDITQAGIIMCKHTASHQHIAQSQGLLRPTRTERSSHSHCAQICTPPCSGHAISSTPCQSAEMQWDCGVGQDFHVDDHMRRRSPLPKPPRTRAKLAERSSAGANEKTAKPEPCERALVPPTPHPPAPQGSDGPPYNSPIAV